MHNDNLLKDFMGQTRKTLDEIKVDVKSLMRFRWMVMGGAIASSFFFTILFEMAKAMAGGK